MGYILKSGMIYRTNINNADKYKKLSNHKKG
jgi:hypothetical protein